MISTFFFPKVRMLDGQPKRGNPSLKRCPGSQSPGGRMKGNSRVGWSSCPVNPASEPAAPGDPLAIASVTIRESAAPGLLFFPSRVWWLAGSFAHILCLLLRFPVGVFPPPPQRADPVRADLKGLCCRGRRFLHCHGSVCPCRGTKSFSSVSYLCTNQ